MDRLIKFRGKDIVERHWRIGSYIYQYLKCPIIQVCKPARAGAASYINWTVDPETVGKFTGFKDIDGKEIYEGDIIQNDYHEEEIYKIIMIGGCWCGLVSGGDIDDDDDIPTLGWLLDNAAFKVIGNIHDNPELLEGGKADD